METALTVITAVLVFGFLIFIHEFGHYIFARIFKVKIHEFSIGMGPRLLEYESKKTGIKYSLASIPIGGFVAMAGEDEESDDPNSFDKKPAWQRFIITVAGAAVNIIAGFAAMIIFTAATNIGTTTVYDFPETDFEISSADTGLAAGDVIVAIDGKSVKIADELSYEIMRRGNEPVDVTVMRDGERIILENVVFPTATESGQTFGVIDFRVLGKKDKSFGELVTHSWRKSVLIVRMCWESIFDLIRGRYTVEAVSGPVGISGAIGDAAKAGWEQLLYITTLISINLGVMNLLPLPALDGGRLISILVEMITRKRIPAKIEQTVNAIGLLILMGLSVIILVKDVIQLF